MKLKCSKNHLQTALQILNGVVPTRTPKDILKNVKLDVSKSTVLLSATDLEMGIRCELPEFEQSSPGSVLVPAQRAAQILRELPADSVEFELRDDALWVRGGRSEFRLSTEDPAEFPDVPPFAEQGCYAISGKALRELIRRTVFATDVESTRYALGGVLTELTDANCTMAATDSRRLAIATAPCRVNGQVSEKAGTPVVPAKAMNLIATAILQEDQDVLLAIRANDIQVKTGLVTINSRLVEGRFPKYQDVIPKSSSIDIEMLVGPFHSAIRQALIVTDDDSRGVDFNFGKGQLTLSSQSSRIGKSTIEMPISYEGEPLAITFDPRFVADFLKVLEPESQIHLKLQDAESAALFTFSDNYSYVVMPLTQERR